MTEKFIVNSDATSLLFLAKKIEKKNKELGGPHLTIKIKKGFIEVSSEEPFNSEAIFELLSKWK